MSAMAEPAVDAAAGDRLARRNALVLAVAQALAGGNNTVLVATAGIVGAMLAPDKSLATLPITIYRPRHVARHAADRLASRATSAGAPPSQIGTCLRHADRARSAASPSFRARSCCSASARSSAASMPPRTSPIASPPPTPRATRSRPKAISWVLVGGVFAGVVGPQLVIVTKDLWPPYLFAASYIAQSAVALAAGGGADAA